MRLNFALLLLAILLFQATLFAVDITACTNMATPNTFYNLTADIEQYGLSCMNITAANITLDCQNHVIGSNRVATTNGILITGSNATVLNCQIRNYTNAVYVQATLATVINATTNDSSNHINFNSAGTYAHFENYTCNAKGGSGANTFCFLATAGGDHLFVNKTNGTGAVGGEFIRMGGRNNITFYDYAVGLAASQSISFRATSASHNVNLTNGYVNNRYDMMGHNLTIDCAGRMNNATTGNGIAVSNSDNSHISNCFFNATNAFTAFTSVSNSIIENLTVIQSANNINLTAFVSSSNNTIRDNLLWVRSSAVGENTNQTCVGFDADSGNNTFYRNNCTARVWAKDSNGTNNFNYSGIGNAYYVCDSSIAICDPDRPAWLEGNGVNLACTTGCPYSDNGYGVNFTNFGNNWTEMGTDWHAFMNGSFTPPADYINITAIAVQPSSPSILDDLSCNITAVSSYESFGANISWLKNGANQTGLATTYDGVLNDTPTIVSTIASGNTSSGENWSCQVYLQNATTFSDANISANVSVSGVAVNYVSSEPADLNISDYYSTFTYHATYNISSIPQTFMDNSTIRLYYKTNDSTLGWLCAQIINGTYNCPFAFNYYNTTPNTTEAYPLYNFSLGEDDIFPSTQNFNKHAYPPAGNYTLTANNQYVATQFLNTTDSNTTYIVEIAINGSGANDVQIFYCNDSVSFAGSFIPQTNSNCDQIGSFPANSSYNYEEDGVGYRVITAQSLNGFIGGVAVSNPSWIVVRGAVGSTVGLRYASVPPRTNAVYVSNNGGGTWTVNTTATPYVYIHLITNVSSFHTYACVNDSLSNQYCSTVRTDLLGVGGLPPSPPQVLIPQNKTYYKNIDNPMNISWVPSVSPNGYAIGNYTIELYNLDDTPNQSIAVVDGSLVNYTWDFSGVEEGQYEVAITANDSLNQTQTANSERFIIRNQTIDQINCVLDYPYANNTLTYCNATQQINITCSDNTDGTSARNITITQSWLNGTQISNTTLTYLNNTSTQFNIAVPIIYGGGQQDFYYNWTGTTGTAFNSSETYLFSKAALGQSWCNAGAAPTAVGTNIDFIPFVFLILWTVIIYIIIKSAPVNYLKNSNDKKDL